MKHLELHILQSFPVVCLNRDELNSPKTAIFGGAQRARVSSQSWKRSIRERARDEVLPTRFKGSRSRYIIEPLTKAFTKLGKSQEEALAVAQELAAALATKDTENRTKTLFYATTGELEQFAQAYASAASSQTAKKAIEALIKKAPGDAADIALFGRMVASDYTATLEGAAMFSHALSTHKVDNEMDFFAAVDDSPPAGEVGAAHTSSLEFNSATYYRYAAVNLDLLKDGDHLGTLTPEDRREVVRAFVEATLTAVPIARRNSMNGHVLPGFVLGIVRKEGHPVQFVNAFEKPVRVNGSGGLFDASVEALKKEHERLNHGWELKKRELASVAMPDKALSQFLDELTAHVD